MSDWNRTIQDMFAAEKQERVQTAFASRSEITLKITVPTVDTDGVMWDLEKLFMGLSYGFQMEARVLPQEKADD